MRVCPKSKNLALVVDVFPQTVYPRGFFNAEKMNTQEIWKPVAECNGEYYVSSWGRVKSLKFGKERILKPGSSQGYLSVIISKTNEKVKCKTIHKLVALAFISNPENKPSVNHKDGNKLNNHIDNLEWNTYKENIQHAWKNGLCESTRVAITKRQSKPVFDLLTNTKYDSLKIACLQTGENYWTQKNRTLNQRKNQRFFYL